jgi:hypothetical protein
MLLGFGKSSPKPAVIVELGWSLWSSLYKIERARLLKRLLASKNLVTQALLEASQTDDDSWVSQVANDIRLQHPTGVPRDQAGWNDLFSHWAKDVRAADAETAWEECQSHPLLVNYAPCPWTSRGESAINTFTHRLPPGEARIISRILCGGQGLRGGDVCAGRRVTVRTACILCLNRGQRRRESLLHFIYECHAYNDLRGGVTGALLAAGDKVPSFHRDVLSSKQLRCLRRFIILAVLRRQRLIAKLSPRVGRLGKLAKLRLLRTLWTRATE